jgi:hypothetical protein
MQCHHLKSCQTHEQYIWRGRASCRLLLVNLPLSKIHVNLQDIEVVTDDGSPAGRKDFLLWQPPLRDEMAPELGRTRSVLEACALFIFLMKRGIRTIVFCKVHSFLPIIDIITLTFS